MTKLLFKIALVHFFINNVSLACSPGPVTASKKPFEYSQAVVKGFYLSSGQFYVIESFDSRYKSSRVYPLTEYGPFGESCEYYELGGGSGEYNMANIKYLKLESTLGDDRKLTTSLVGEFPPSLPLLDVLNFSNKLAYGPYWLKPKRLVKKFREELSVDFVSGKLEYGGYSRNRKFLNYSLDTGKLDRYLRGESKRHPKAKRMRQRLSKEYHWVSKNGEEPVVLVTQGEEGNVWCAYDTEANLLVPCKYSHIKETHGYLLAETEISVGSDSFGESFDYRYTVFDLSGKQLMPDRYESIEFNKEGLIIAHLNGLSTEYNPNTDEKIIRRTAEIEQ